jgi:hypothetical protein
LPARELATFDRQIQRARDLVGTAVALETSLTGAMDVSDLFRGAFVQAVSALDTFIHAEVKARMIAAFAAGGPFTPAFDRYRVSLASVRLALANQGNPGAQLNWLDSEVQEQHSYLSFQQPDKIADAVRLVSGVKLWDEVANYLGQGPVGADPGSKVVKRRLTLIVDRRNTIVHESDLDPTPPGDRLYPMDRATAEGAIDFVEAVGRAIYAVA